MVKLITTLGEYTEKQLGMILPHEHIFVDLGPIEDENWKYADPDAVVSMMVPELERAREVGVTALVECTPAGVGRRADIVTFLETRGIEYRTDASNQDIHYRRNRIRLELMPALKTYNPRIVPNLVRLADIVRGDDQWLDTVSRVLGDLEDPFPGVLEPSIRA